jgi:uncharacterized protein YfkK (UPF0435 family)
MNSRPTKRHQRVARELAKTYMSPLAEDALRDIAAALRFVSRRKNPSITTRELGAIAADLERMRVAKARRERAKQAHRHAIP